MNAQGEWTHKESGVGTSIDSFYEYLLKAYIALGDPDLLSMFSEAYRTVKGLLYKNPW